jgi:hypothetical protein
MANPPSTGIPIMTIAEQRVWNNNQKESKIITSLIDIDNDVFHYERDLFARWYDLNHFNVNEILRGEVKLLPHFKEVKIYYNCNLNREEYIKAGYITGLIYNTPHNSTYSSSSSSPPIHRNVGRDVIPSKVGRKTVIVGDDELPVVCKPGGEIVRPDRTFNWNDRPFDAEENLLQWLAGMGTCYPEVQLMWQHVRLSTDPTEYPPHPLADGVKPLPELVRFWEYYLPDNKREIRVMLFKVQFQAIVAHSFFVEVYAGGKNFNHI